MNTSRETVMETLKQAGINQTYEEVVANFETSDVLSGYLAGAVDQDAAILAHLPEYMDLMGYNDQILGNTNPVDPTATQNPSSAAMPSSVTSAQASAIAHMLNADLATRKAFSAQAEVTTVLIDKPYPGDWMQGVGKLHTKKDAKEVADSIKERYHSDRNIDNDLTTPGVKFIPTTEQLVQLMERDKAQHPDRKTVPIWYNFDNDTAVNGVLSVLTEGDGCFDVLIAPKEDEGEGAYKNKAWRWNTQGYVIKAPTTGAGETGTEELSLNKKQVMGLLATKAAGIIPAKHEGGLAVKLGTVKSKNVGTNVSAGAVAEKTVLRVSGNSPAAKPQTIAIKTQSGGEGTMTVRSSAFFFAVSVSKTTGAWRITKERIALAWEHAPVWITRSEYFTTFGEEGKKDGMPTPEDLLKYQRSAANLIASVFAGGADSASLYGMGQVFLAIEERVNRDATKAADALSI